MCGIVGLFLKDKRLGPDLGTLISEMLVKMSDRGPDSAGLALYNEGTEFTKKITLKTNKPNGCNIIKEAIEKKAKNEFQIKFRGDHWIVSYSPESSGLLTDVLRSLEIVVQVMSEGECIEIYKEACSPKTFIENCNIKNFSGTHAVGHTRMATESAVTTLGAHPFSTAEDQCLVHNGSLSNHNIIRRLLRSEGFEFETDNDSEVAASYLSWKISTGMSLEKALDDALKSLDGFFTFLVGTKKGFGVLRDKIACKPAVLAETDQYVAFGSEYRALTDLPGIASAKVWEPKPAQVYFWTN